MIKFTGDLRCDFEKATAEITKLKDRILGYQEKITSLQTTVKNLKRSKDSDKKQYMESPAEKDAIIKELQNRLAHAEALLNHDGSNTGTPTSQTTPNKNKVILNSRRNAGTPRVDRLGIKNPPLKNQMNLGLQMPLDTHCNMINAVPNAGLLIAPQPAKPK